MGGQPETGGKEGWTEPVVTPHEALRDVTGQKYIEMEE